MLMPIVGLKGWNTNTKAMSHYDPQVELPLPADYLEKCHSLEDDIRIGNAVIYKWGKDPGVIGKAGTENFWKSLLIGRMDGGQTIILTCDSDGYGRNRRWVYQIAKYAEWHVDWRFDRFDDLLSFLKTYKGIDL
jgi:hypothetical protein